MKPDARLTKAAGIGGEAVLAKTGKTWSAWFAVLDAGNAAAMSHRQMVAFLGERYRLAPWWQQMVTVAYEQARGLRVRHQTATGFAVSVSRTVAVPVAELFAAWGDEGRRGRWLPDPGIVVRAATGD